MRSERLIPIVVSACVTACGSGDGRDASATPPSDEVETVAQEPATPEIAPQADEALREMSDYLAGLQGFTVHTEGSIEVVLKDGQKLAFPFASNVQVRRPDRLRSDRVGEATAMQFYYDGRTFTLFGEKARLWARADAPPTLDEAIEAARVDLDLEAPGADLLSSDVYATLTEDVVSGFVVGDAMIDGTKCRHLAFRGNEVDWQIWIEDGPRPVPRRYSITSKRIEGAPAFTVELKDWDTSANPPDSVFQFTPPPDATRIDFFPRRPGKTS
jgi:hypothetical protein